MMFDIFDIFDNSDFFQSPVSYREEVRCPVCNMTYSDFKRSGKLGCSECYTTFRNPLYEVLLQLHRSPVHTGKVPGKLKGTLSKKRKLEELREKLQIAVKNEQYEEAAKIHKEILDIEKG